MTRSFFAYIYYQSKHSAYCKKGKCLEYTILFHFLHDIKFNLKKNIGKKQTIIS